nr:mucin-5AC-like [Procambarus clarkii]XP_045599914.1 mucin-5AC-like [Procambarus clarkii]
MDNIYWLLLLVALGAIFLQESLARQGNSNCPWIDLENGRVKLRSQGRVAKFKCKKGFTRFEGDRFAACVRNEWNGKIPKCIRHGCVNVAAPEHGQREYLYRNAVVLFTCDPGYHLQGSPALSCNAINWNHTAPTCVAPANPAMVCDFENEDLCGWSNVRHDDFDWVRKRGPSNSFMAGTGPSADHTLGTNAGHYMYVDASVPREEGHKALLFSPVYSPAVLSGVSCFSFYFHKYGRNSGALNAYVKPEGISLDFLPPFLQMSDSSEARWFFHKINLTNTRYNFQIVLEAIRDVTNSDMAVDDVKLAHGDDCSDHYTMSEVRPEVTSPQLVVSPTPMANTTTAHPTTTVAANTNATIHDMFTSGTKVNITSVANSTSSNMGTESSSVSYAQSNASISHGMNSTSGSINISYSTSTPATIHRPQDSSDSTSAVGATSTAKPATSIDTNVTATTPSSPDNATTPAGVATQPFTAGKDETHTTPEGTESGDDLQSCQGRCGEIAIDEEACGCDIECGNESTCCVDMATFCSHYLSTPKTVSVFHPTATSASTILTAPSVSPVPASVTNLSKIVTTTATELSSSKLTTPVTVPARPFTHPIEVVTFPAPVTIKILTEAPETTLQERTPKPTTLAAKETVGPEVEIIITTTGDNIERQTASTVTEDSTTESPADGPTTTQLSEATTTEARELSATISSISTTKSKDDTVAENKGKLTTKIAEVTNKTTSTALPTTTETSDSWTLSASKGNTSQPSPTNLTSKETSFTDDQILPTINENKVPEDSRRMSRGTAVLITILVVTGILLVAVVVFVYVRKIRNQYKLPDDSDILFLARDEVQMVDNITDLYGERPRRGTPV